MAKILIVHGISNQFEGEMELRGPWYRALCDGLLRVGHETLPQESDCFCPFYGDLFRPAGHLGVGGAIDESDVEDANADEAVMIEAVWHAAIEDDPSVPGPAAYADTLAYAPRIVERALTSLAKAKYLADYTPLQLFGDLKQVVAYVNDPSIRACVLDRVFARIEPDTRIIIGHSLGSVVAYEAVCAKPANILTFLTLGSPLGIRNVVFDKLKPAPRDGRGRWPGQVKTWANIAARGDIVAAQKTLAPFFEGVVDDRLIASGWEAHSSSHYLNHREAGSVLAAALET